MHSVRLSSCLALWGWLVGCEAAPIGSGRVSQLDESSQVCCGQAAEASAGRVAKGSSREDAARSFGAKLTLTDSLPVAQVLAEPDPYLGQNIQCTGVIARVCERAGCWLELRGEAAPGQIGLRVPMAGHAFFIPQDVVGRPARVEGKLTARELGAGERAHLEGEGLKAVGPLALTATAVVVY